MKEREVPFFDYPAVFHSGEDEYLSAIHDALSGGRFILQRELEAFESRLAEYLGVGYALGVGNGTDALILALEACGICEGDEVIVPSHTFIASAAAVHHAGGTPVLVDVGNDHMIDPELIEKAIGPKTRAIMPVQLNGRTCDMHTILKLAETHDLVVIEDAAQALGASFDGKKAGTFGRASGFSFYPAKLLGCFGDGGAVVTDDPDVAERVRALRDHGRLDSGRVARWSYNSRLDNVQAAVLNVRLKSFESELKRRREIARRYDEALSGYDALRLPPAPTTNGIRRDVFQNYEVESPQRDALRQFLDERGVGTIVQWGGYAVHEFDELGFSDVTLPVTERVMERSFLLPMHPFLSDDDVRYVCETVAEFF